MGAHIIRREIEIDAPCEVVWRTITEADQVRRWLCDSVELEARTDSVGTFTFGDAGSGDSLVVKVSVVEADPQTRFSFRWCAPDGADPTAANSVLVTFTLDAIGDERTRLRVEETGLDDLDWPDGDKDSYSESHNDGWRTRGEALRRLFVTAGD